MKEVEGFLHAVQHKVTSLEEKLLLKLAVEQPTLIKAQALKI